MDAYHPYLTTDLTTLVGMLVALYMGYRIGRHRGGE